jgi:hypothetical protein
MYEATMMHDPHDPRLLELAWDPNLAIADAAARRMAPELLEQLEHHPLTWIRVIAAGALPLTSPALRRMTADRTWAVRYLAQLRLEPLPEYVPQQLTMF